VPTQIVSRALPWLSLLTCIMLPVALIAAARPRSDSVLIAQFARSQPALERLVATAQRDDVAMYIGAWTTTWPDDLATRLGDAERIGAYRAQLRAASVAGLSTSGEGAAVSFPLGSLLPGAPVKSFLYSPASPPTVTDGPTEQFSFAPGAFRRVCRPLAEDWYLCLDYED
jgi:hypothetical protein